LLPSDWSLTNDENSPALRLNTRESGTFIFSWSSSAVSLRCVPFRSVAHSTYIIPYSNIKCCVLSLSSTLLPFYPPCVPFAPSTTSHSIPLSLYPSLYPHHVPSKRRSHGKRKR
jgi:hypothetical protein